MNKESANPICLSSHNELADFLYTSRQSWVLRGEAIGLRDQLLEGVPHAKGSMEEDIGDVCGRR